MNIFSNYIRSGNSIIAIFITWCAISAVPDLNARPVNSLTSTGTAIKIYRSHSHTVPAPKNSMIAPTVQSVSPAQHALHVARNTTVQVTFDQAMLPGSFDDETSFIVSGMISGRHTGTFGFTGGNTVATFTPAEPFAYGEIVMVQLTSSLQSSGSEALMPFVYTFTSETRPSSGTFTPKTDYGTGTDPYSVFVSDLNGDGFGDLAVTNATTSGGSVSILLNKGNGTFNPKTDYGVGNNPESVFVSDLDGDGFGDLAVANALSASVSVLLNQGDGTFAPKTDYGTGGFPTSVFVSDLDGDGDGDLAVANSDANGNNVSILKNNGDGTFATKDDYGTGDIPQSVFVSDLDGDGDGDLAVANKNPNTVSVLLNQGDGTFDEKVDYDTGSTPFSVFVSDLDGDGDGDLAVANQGANTVSILKNNGDGTFAEKIDYAALGQSTFSVFVSDLDGDGDGDLAVVNSATSTVSILKNNGDGTFAPETNYGVGGGPRSVFVSDLDGDGFGDLAVANNTPNTVSILNNVELEEAHNQSLAFDGVDQYVDLGSDPAAVSGLPNLTVEAWVKPEAFESNDLILEKEDEWYLQLGANFIQWTIHGDGSDRVISDILSANQWYHVAATYDGTDYTLYINGVSQGSNQFGSGTNNSTFPLTLAARRSSGGSATNFFHGSIDEVRIWGDVRTQDEIRGNMFQSLNGDEAGLVAYWPLQEGGGSAVFDLSTNDHHGSLINGPAWNEEGHPYGTFITGDEGWRMMTSPVDGASYGTLLDTLWTQGFTGADVSGGTSNVYRWNETGQQFESIANATDVPAAGTGFVFYVYADDDPDAGGQGGFPKIIMVDSAQNSGTITPTLTWTNTGVPDSVGWNLVGNPYGATIDWDAASGWTKTNLNDVFYVWSDSAGGGAGAYLSWSSGGGGTLPNSLIAPWQGFWVQATADAPAMQMTDEVRSAGGVFLKEKPVPQIRFKLAQRRSAPTAVGTDPSELRSSAVVMFNGQASPGKDRLDAWKLASLNSERYLSLYTTGTGGEALDINALPLEIDRPLELTLDFEGSNLGGSYNLSWNPQALPETWAQGAVMLTDLHTDRIIDLSQAGEYTFEVEAAKAKGSGVQLPPNHTNKSGLAQASTLEPYSPKRGRFGQPGHGPIPTVLKAKATNPRFLLTINPAGSLHRLAGIPEAIELAQNYPNPFNPETVIRYGVPEQSSVQLTVFDILGRKVATLLNEQKTPGRYQVNFDASRFASGLYIYRLKVGSNVLTKKMMLIK